MTDQPRVPGPLVLCGGEEELAPQALVDELVAHAGDEVLVLPTAAAFERPERALESAARLLATRDVRAEAVMVLTRRDAESARLAARVREARAVLLVGGSPLHLRSVLKDSAVLAALIAAWHGGATVASGGEATTALSDPMVDPRGGAFTVGLGLARELAIVPNHRDDAAAQFRRTLALAPCGCAIVGIAPRTALVRDPDGLWRSIGAPAPSVYLAGAVDSLACLAGKATA